MPNICQILIVDDDPELRHTLTEQLSLLEEFEAVAVEDGQQGRAGRQGRANRPGDHGRGPAGHRRSRSRAHLAQERLQGADHNGTGYGTDSDTILGLDSGANDYVTKPFRFAVLLARIRAQLRQHETSEDVVFTIGPYAFRPRSKLLLNSKGSKVRLSEKESSILRYLYGDGQRAVPRETLLREVWGYNSEITTHTVETHIYRLRQKIEQNAAAPAILLTEAGGYKLVP
jgi:DNA-binding response OmpR family regulator